PAEDGEILAEHEDEAAVDRAVAGDDAIARHLLLADAEIVAAVLDEHVPFLEGIGVEQDLDALARGQLALVVLRLDPARAAAGKGVYSDPVMQKFLDVAIENVFGNLWTRPGLDDKTRALICVISDTCTGREPELALHLRMALRQGWTEAELTEVLLHLSGYIG